MRRVLVSVLLLAGCTVAPAGGPCARNSDCATAYCSPTGTCAVPLDAASDDGFDADTTIPPLDGDPTVDAPADAPEDPDAAPDAPPDAV